MNRPYPHCTHCGATLPETQWPRTCACGRMHFLNPTPVAVLLQPIQDQGILTIKRAIPPKVGELALPGGYVDVNETWQQACARELKEETGLGVDAAHIEHFATISSERGDGVILIFGLAPALDPEALHDFVPGEEASELVVVPEAQTLAFPLHTQVLAQWFD